jgi:hypothetical protein
VIAPPPNSFSRARSRDCARIFMFCRQICPITHGETDAAVEMIRAQSRMEKQNPSAFLGIAAKSASEKDPLRQHHVLSSVFGQQRRRRRRLHCRIPLSNSGRLRCCRRCRRHYPKNISIWPRQRAIINSSWSGRIARVRLMFPPD